MLAEDCCEGEEDGGERGRRESEGKKEEEKETEGERARARACEKEYV